MAGTGTDTTHSEDHPQTIKLENDSRGGPEGPSAKERAPRPDYGSEGEKASTVPANAELGEDAQAVRRDGQGGTIGEATGSGIEPDVGSGTPPDRSSLSSGDAPIMKDSKSPLGTYTPGGED